MQWYYLYHWLVSYVDYDCHLMLGVLSTLENSLTISHTLHCSCWNDYHTHIINSYNQNTNISCYSNQGATKRQVICTEGTKVRAFQVPSSESGVYMVRIKVKASHTCYRTLGSELIPVYRQSARRWLYVIHPAVGCHYFPPGLWLPSQPQSITATWPVPSYTAWRQRHIGVNNLLKVFTQLLTRVGFEPTTCWLQVQCSTIALLAILWWG